MTSTVGERGQITIEKPIRDRLGIKPKDVAVQHLEDGHLIITFLPAPHRRSLRGVLKPRPARPIKDFGQVREVLETRIAEDAEHDQ
ncbi:MAG: AbrB/MazE/SpoVT family DNA-binding domain-containing protein [Chloroflexi bacterium]|nr:AbrB/MazE/SpoVT family DNA-binding domain-containing protein [Chloroflexota bacterium]